MHMRALPSALLTHGYPAHTRGIFQSRRFDAAAAVNQGSIHAIIHIATGTHAYRPQRRQRGNSHRQPDAMTQARKILVWMLLAALAAIVSYLGFRGYLSPELLINFSNSFHC